jgi:hypothetical protein
VNRASIPEHLLRIFRKLRSDHLADARQAARIPVGTGPFEHRGDGLVLELGGRRMLQYI